jgi:hypothetical protein
MGGTPLMLEKIKSPVLHKEPAIPASKTPAPSPAQSETDRPKVVSLLDRKKMK